MEPLFDCEAWEGMGAACAPGVLSAILEVLAAQAVAPQMPALGPVARPRVGLGEYAPQPPRHQLRQRTLEVAQPKRRGLRLAVQPYGRKARGQQLWPAGEQRRGGRNGGPVTPSAPDDPGAAPMGAIPGGPASGPIASGGASLGGGGAGGLEGGLLEEGLERERVECGLYLGAELDASRGLCVDDHKRARPQVRVRQREHIVELGPGICEAEGKAR